MGFKVWKIGHKWPKTSETQSLRIGNLIKSLREVVNLGQIALKQACTSFFLRKPQRKPRASAVSLGFLAMGNMLSVVSLGQMILKQEWTIFLEHLRGNQGHLQLVRGLWQCKICFKLFKIGQKWPQTSETQSLPFGHFIKSLREAVNLGHMPLKQACINCFWEHSSRHQGLLQVV